MDKSFAKGSTDNITAMLVVFPAADRFNTPLAAPQRRWTFGRKVKKPNWVSALFGAFGGGGNTSDGESDSESKGGGSGRRSVDKSSATPTSGEGKSSTQDALAAARAASAAESSSRGGDGPSPVAENGEGEEEENAGEMRGSILQVLAFFLLRCTH